MPPAKYFVFNLLGVLIPAIFASAYSFAQEDAETAHIAVENPADLSMDEANKIYDALKATFLHDNTVKDLSFPEFRRIYEPFIQSQLSLRRQYIQSRAQDAFHRKFWLSLR